MLIVLVLNSLSLLSQFPADIHSSVTAPIHTIVIHSLHKECNSIGFGFTAVANFVCLDELIRQVTINCAERGLLLLRVRDEIRMTIAAYQTLYESSVAFGMRKALQAEQGKADMEKKVSAG